MGRVRCFCVGIFEGSCINPFWEVGGSRFFSQKISKIPRLNPPPIKDVPSFSHAPSRTDGPDVTYSDIQRTKYKVNTFRLGIKNIFQV